VQVIEKRKNRLNILFIPKWYPSEIHFKSGIFVEEFAKVASLYHQVTVLFVYPSTKRFKGFYEIAQDEKKGDLRVIKVRYKPSLPLPGIIETALFNWWIKYIFNKHLAPNYKPDIIHAHIFKAGPAALAIGKLTNSPVLLSEHSMEFTSKKYLTLEFRIFAKHILNKFARILPVNYALKDNMQALAPKAKFTVLPNVVNTELFHPAFAKTQLDNKKRILHVSGLTYVKRIQDILKVLSIIKEKRQDFLLDIVGDGPEKKKAEQLTAQYNLKDFVTFHGMKSKEAVAQFMRKCDFFILPSLTENLPCVILEAQACGKPVIASKVGGIPEIVKDGENGILIHPKNNKALQSSIEYMLDNYSRYSSQKIVDYVQANFSYQAVAGKLDQIYQDTVKQWRQNHG